jgi:hypothetical protein
MPSDGERQVDTMTALPDQTGSESPVVHQLKNHLSIIVGFCDLLLGDLPQDDRKRVDVEEVRKAGQAALDLLPDIIARMR